ncbi:hypothetical protein CROQUDRAFT_287768 [Cronartium quercuum f. sp. fusiforme G11]|uniref:Uncharacterized protein n=1 Tax=Cronartium quercuum f. sp. fusiforme G11 TaxID=708437 RepID=A0A9P6TGE0_9BASI|nr:hypothetical protein CROQUDRAFT_287768 [Cronartium quercuum f. sp. fusiforme G11]
MKNDFKIWDPFESEIWKIIQIEAHQAKWDPLVAEVVKFVNAPSLRRLYEKAKRFKEKNDVPDWRFLIRTDEVRRLKASEEWERENDKYQFLVILRQAMSTIFQTLQDNAVAEDEFIQNYLKAVLELVGKPRMKYTEKLVELYSQQHKRESKLINHARILIRGYHKLNSPDQRAVFLAECWMRLLTALSLTNSVAAEVLDTAQALKIPGAEEGWEIYLAYSKPPGRPSFSPEFLLRVKAYFKMGLRNKIAQVIPNNEKALIWAAIK